MTQYPLFFTYRDRLFGNGFLAEVTSHGRILCAHDENEYWVYGVEPGGISATGDDTRAALEAYRESFASVLIDLAADAPSFEDFKTAAEGFFAEINEPYAEEWRRAVDEVRSAHLDLEMRREKADALCYVKVEPKHQASFSPKDNKRAKLDATLATRDTKAA